MTIAAISENHRPEEIKAFFPNPSVDWLLLKTVPRGKDHPSVELYLDLDFNNGEERKQALAKLLPTPVFVNAVTSTLGEIGFPFIRFNGWPGFRKGNVHELVTPDEATAEKVTELYARLGCSYRQAPDTPGMIGPRILAGIINEAWFTWEEEVSSKEEIDTAMKLGTNYPLGPFEWGEAIGIGQIIGLLRSLSRDDARYTPAKALQQAFQALKCD